MDSDGDGMTNSQELGDPQCIWTPGATPTTTVGLTHPGVRKRVLKFPRTPIPDKETTYMCMTYDLDETKDYHLIATKPEVDNVHLVHHMLLYGCHDGARVIARPGNCGIFSPVCPDQIGKWGVGVSGQCFYKETGFRIGKTGYKRVLLEIHWNNPQKLPGKMDGSGFSMFYTPNLRPYDAGVFWTGENNLVIPPGQSRTVVESMCTPRCTKKILTDTIYLIEGYNHMHYKGIAQTVELFSGDTRRYLTNDQNYHYDSPTHVRYDPPVAVRPGDSLKTTCVYRSVSSKKTTFYGLATSDEMCYSGFVYYPKTVSRKNRCISFKTLDLCDMESGVLLGCNIVDFCNNSHPNTKIVMDKVMVNCSPNSGCREKCPAAIAEAEKHPCLATGAMKGYMLAVKSRKNPGLKTTEFVAALRSCESRKDERKEENNNGNIPTETRGQTYLDFLVLTGVLAFCVVVLLYISVCVNTTLYNMYILGNSQRYIVNSY